MSNFYFIDSIWHPVAVKKTAGAPVPVAAYQTFSQLACNQIAGALEGGKSRVLSKQTQPVMPDVVTAAHMTPNPNSR